MAVDLLNQNSTKKTKTKKSTANFLKKIYSIWIIFFLMLIKISLYIIPVKPKWRDELRDYSREADFRRFFFKSFAK